MFENFKNQLVALAEISLDSSNPRIVTPTPLSNTEEILEYFFKYEKLQDFIEKIALEGLNIGAEKPYLIQRTNGYVVIEGNTRIAAYKILTGLYKAPKEFASKIPQISNDAKKLLLNLECTIAPSRDDLLVLMAEAHFGLGNKTKWSYLGSRLEVHNQWNSGKDIAELSKTFGYSKSEIRSFLMEYKIYTSALQLNWTEEEKEKLLNPKLQFNKPIRFLQTSQHKEKIGLNIDYTNLELNFNDDHSKQKFRHLIFKMLIKPVSGITATSSYQDVFSDFNPNDNTSSSSNSQSPSHSTTGPTNSNRPASKSPSTKPASTTSSKKTTKPNILFAYEVSKNNSVLKQLMSEASKINTKNLPGASTALLRAIIETVLKIIIDENNANAQNRLLSLESCVKIALNKSVPLSKDDQRILSEFNKHHLDYLNLGSHGTVVPNQQRLNSVRDCIDQFIMRNV